MDDTTAPIHLGDRARDLITDYEGVVTGECRYLTGCEQVLLSPKVGDDGKLRGGEWFDADRCVVIEPCAVMIGRAAVQLPDGVTTIGRTAAGPDTPPPVY